MILQYLYWDKHFICSLAKYIPSASQQVHSPYTTCMPNVPVGLIVSTYPFQCFISIHYSEHTQTEGGESAQCEGGSWQGQIQHIN